MNLGIGISRMPESPNTADIWRRAMANADGTVKTMFADVWSVQRDFDFLATSYDADSEKPDLKVFNYAANLARLNVVSRVEQVKKDGSASVSGAFGTAKAIITHRNDIVTMPWIHVGDDYSKDYLGAKESGVDAFHLVREGDGHKPVEGAQTISNLIELLPIVNVMAQTESVDDRRVKSDSLLDTKKRSILTDKLTSEASDWV